MTREQVAYLGGIMIEAGANTTTLWMHTLVLAMIAFPEAQKKAQVSSILLRATLSDHMYFFIGGVGSGCGARPYPNSGGFSSSSIYPSGDEGVPPMAPGHPFSTSSRNHRRS
jgi:hypothetical protein